MYNRYIPQADGSYQRKQMRDNYEPGRSPEHNSAPAKENIEPPPPTPTQQPQHTPPHNTSIPGFFRQLLPRGVDTTDLLILVLLLLMAGDREEERNNALLTIALYFIL